MLKALDKQYRDNGSEGW